MATSDDKPAKHVNLPEITRNIGASDRPVTPPSDAAQATSTIQRTDGQGANSNEQK